MVKKKHTIGMEWDDPFSKKVRYDKDPTSENPNDWDKTKNSKKKKKSPEIFLIESPDQVKQQEQYLKNYSDAIMAGDQKKIKKLKAPDLSSKSLFGIEFKDATDTAKGVKAIYAPNMRNTSDQQKNDSAGLSTMAGVFHGNYANPLYENPPEQPDMTYGGLSETSVDWQGNVKLNPTAGAQASSRLKHKSRAKVANFLENASKDATLSRANKILADLGRSQITTKVTRRRRGRWSVSLTGDPKAVIQKYEEDKALIEWGKKVGGLALDPERKVTVIDTEVARRVPQYWTHNNRRRLTGYSTVYDRTYKEVLATSRPKGEQMDLLVAKLNKEAGQKKERFGRLYDHDPEIPDHVYYSVTEEQFQESEKYKSDLITGINTQQTSTTEMRNAMAQSPFVDSPSSVDDNSPKISYLNYQKTGQDKQITPIVSQLSSKVTGQEDVEQQNLKNSISFIEGKSKEMIIGGKSVASRDNMGYITVTDKETYSKYISKTPEKYIHKKTDNLQELKISELEEKYTTESEKHSETYDTIKKFEEAEKKKVIALREAQIREERQRNQVLQSSGQKRAKVRNTTPTRVRRR
jgi:hypothetical protein